jgi:hypothetical protein
MNTIHEYENGQVWAAPIGRAQLWLGVLMPASQTNLGLPKLCQKVTQPLHDDYGMHSE